MNEHEIKSTVTMTLEDAINEIDNPTWAVDDNDVSFNYVTVPAAKAVLKELRALEVKVKLFADRLCRLSLAIGNLSNCYYEGPEAKRVTRPCQHMEEFAMNAWKHLRKATDALTDPNQIDHTLASSVFHDALNFAGGLEAVCKPPAWPKREKKPR